MALQIVWWTPFLASSLDGTLQECSMFSHHNVSKAFSAPLAYIPPPDGPFQHLMMDLDMAMWHTFQWWLADLVDG